MGTVVSWLLPVSVAVQINEPNAYGNTPLHVACYNGQDVVVNELIECGANVNQVNEKGFAPLHFTAASRHGALCLELLVCNGADVNIKVSKNQNVALTLISWKRKKIAHCDLGKVLLNNWHSFSKFSHIIEK